MAPSIAALFLMAGGALMVPMGDAFAKEIARTTDIGPFFVAFARFALGAVIFIPLTLAAGQGIKLTVRSVYPMVIRGLFICLGVLCIVTAVAHAPLAEVFGAFFIGPAVATLIARFLLREEVTKREWLALALGLAGVLMVTRPGAEMNAGHAWALAAGCFYGCYNGAARWSAGFAPPLAQISGQLFFAALILSPFALSEIDKISEAPGLLTGSGLLSAIANLFLLLAYARERAGVLAPLIYLQLVSAAAIGWAVFGEAPDLMAALGLGVILFAGLGLRWRGLRARRSD